MNRLQLDAEVLEREASRYTPAGIPIVACTLRHRAEVVEAGMPRQVEMTLQAVAAGLPAGELERCELGVVIRFDGFLAQRNRNTRAVVFHITELQYLGKD